MHPLTLAEHVELGDCLKAAREALGRVVTTRDRPHPRASPVGSAAARVLAAVDVLAGLLDSEVRSATRGRDPRGLASRVYRGPRLVPWDSRPEDSCPAALPGDAFAAWARITEEELASLDDPDTLYAPGAPGRDAGGRDDSGARS